MNKTHTIIEDLNMKRLIGHCHVIQLENERCPRGIIDWKPSGAKEEDQQQPEKKSRKNKIRRDLKEDDWIDKIG